MKQDDSSLEPCHLPKLPQMQLLPLWLQLANFTEPCLLLYC